MKDKDVIEGNRMIAKFMGYRTFSKRYPRNHGIGAPEAEWKDMIIEKAKYHSSWDWQIPVYVKLSSELLKLSMSSLFKERYAYLHDKYIPCVEAGNILKAHKYLSETIQWYNQTKQQQQ